MIRLSLVNMYLNGFQTPKIEEYDTLSNEDKWNEYYDVILANPPFFSPKGGIKPHKRFGVESKKAEVLFTSYILEHLKPEGRAGIIVPEGIIFQTGTAYKELRKQLIENGLVGVVSLPAGVFQPYSGVKTSILILDKKLNKESDSIFFAEIKNDGFNLGAQRDPIKENDLPQISTAIASGKEVDDIIFYIKKEIILKDKSYALTSRKYKEVEEVNSNYPLVPISEVYKVISPPIKIKSKEFLTNGKVPIIDQSKNQIAGYWNNEKDRVVVENSVIIFGDHTKSIKFVDFDFVAGADGIKILNPGDEILPKFLFYIIKSIKLPDLGYSRHYKELKDKKIPLPTLEVQQEIVEELEEYQKIIDGCKQVVENYKPTIDIDQNWKMVELGKVCDNFQNGANFSSEQKGGGTKIIGVKNIFSDFGYIDNSNLDRVQLSDKEIESKKVYKDDILFVRSSVKYEGVGYPALASESEENISFAGFVIKASPNKKIIVPFFLCALLLSDRYRKITIQRGNRGTITNISQDNLKTIKIPLPPIETQKEIVKKIDEERKVIEGNKKLIEIYTQKIQNRINKVWGED